MPTPTNTALGVSHPPGPVDGAGNIVCFSDIDGTLVHYEEMERQVSLCCMPYSCLSRTLPRLAIEVSASDKSSYSDWGALWKRTSMGT